MNIAAGLLNEKLGTMEMPLLVALKEPENWVAFGGLAVVCAKDKCVTLINATNPTILLITALRIVSFIRWVLLFLLKKGFIVPVIVME
jgi:hypothetical protein